MVHGLAIVVVNQVGTTTARLQGEGVVGDRRRGQLRLRPAVFGREWDWGIGIRCVVYREFLTQSQLQSLENIEGTEKKRLGWRSVRWVEVVKGGCIGAVSSNGRGEDDVGGLNRKRRRVAFEIDDVSINPFFSLHSDLSLLTLGLGLV